MISTLANTWVAVRAPKKSGSLMGPETRMFPDAWPRREFYHREIEELRNLLGAEENFVDVRFDRGPGQRPRCIEGDRQGLLGQEGELAVVAKGAFHSLAGASGKIDFVLFPPQAEPSSRGKEGSTDSATVVTSK